ncbi:UDP-glucose 4-epimerase [Polynucleobacter yangtzensis]|uniref:UDP-glucose 4-epimerase n=1 Tax=Polynucleobacter yangtzensis TaxID=1743159 RepID=A0A9C7C434_9BURK|nr:UDP-glucose 4-epimerase GalE [Polynucleobacter yangtzensis]BDT76513.1 UDP-glucose 4-epimerase [Polynucleobacter yangtzensis]
MTILITGGLGFIASHAAASLLESNQELVLLDNLCNSQESVHQKLEKLTDRKFPFYRGDVRDKKLLRKIFSDHSITAVMHFAGLKSVAESVKDPLLYFDNNVGGTITLLEVMQELGVYQFIFSSSATVYGVPEYLPYDESHPTKPINPYGQSKLQVEAILKDLAASDSRWAIACLRYFNPVGAHPSHLIGELPNDQPNNLMPFMMQVAAKQRPFLTVFGNDYETADGTGERDYIHVMDLAEGHEKALALIQKTPGMHIINLGTGKPHSVLELVRTFEKVTGESIPMQIGKRRDGDLPVYYASADKAKDVLQWQATRTLADMCLSSWQFQLQHLSS